MANVFLRVFKGIQLKAVTADPGDNIEGSIWYNSTDLVLKSYIDSAIRTMVSTDQVQSLTNKTLSGPTNVISIDDDSLSIVDEGDNTKVAQFQVSDIPTGTTKTYTLPTFAAGSDEVLTGTATQTITNKTINSGTIGATNTVNVTDSTFSIQDEGDATKIAKLQVAGITTGTTRTFSVPDADGTLVLAALAQTLTNKTIDADSNTISNIDNNEIKAAAAIAVDKLAALTTDRVAITDGSGFLAVSAATATEAGYLSGVTSSIQSQLDTKITETSVNTLTNKTMDGDLNTFSDVGITSLKTEVAQADKFISRDGSGVVIDTVDVPAGDVVGTTDSQTLTNKAITGANIDQGTASDTQRIVLPKETTVNLDALTDTQALIAYDTTQNLPVYNAGAGWVALEAGVAPTVVEENLIINGGMDAWQRETIFPSISSGDFGPDRWKYGASGTTGVLTYSRSTNVPTVTQSGHASQYSLRVAVDTADAVVGAGDLALVRHYIEGYNFAAIHEQTVTLSFWVYATKTGISCVYFKNAAQDRTYVAEYTVDASNTWEKKTITLDLDTAGTWLLTNGVGMEVTWTLMGGTSTHTTKDSWNAGSFRATANQVNHLDSTSNIFQLTQIKLEQNSTATAFKRAGGSIAGEFELCQRYYEKSYNENTYGGAINNTGSYSYVQGIGSNQSDQQTLQFRTTKRASPSVTLYSPNNGASGVWYSASQGANVAVTVFNNGENAFSTNCTALNVEQRCIGHWTAESEL